MDNEERDNVIYLTDYRPLWKPDPEVIDEVIDDDAPLPVIPRERLDMLSISGFILLGIMIVFLLTIIVGIIVT